jgi:hypothetical protein
MLGWLKRRLRRWLGVEGCQAVPSSHNFIHCWDVRKDGTRVSQPYRVIGLVGVLGLRVVSVDGTVQRCAYRGDVVESDIYWYHIRRLLPRHVFEWEDLPPPKQSV